MDTRVFLQGNEDLSLAVVARYDVGLVAVSLVVATIAAWVALLVVERAIESLELGARRGWLAAGACVMGIGIWDMHFLGMLASELPVAVSYDASLTLASVLPAILGSAVGLRLIARGERSLARVNVAGACMGLGIGSMHYVGMAAMRAPLEMRFSPSIVVLSVLVAWVLAALALFGQLRLWASPASGIQSESLPSGDRREAGRIVGAVVLGLAVSGMHYTGMTAAVYLPASGDLGSGHAGAGLRAEPLAWLVTIGTGVVLIGALLGVIVDRRLQQMSSSLRASEQRMRMILENMAEGLFSMDARGIISRVNAGAVRILGHRSEQLEGEHVGDLIPAFAGSAPADWGVLHGGEESSGVIELDARHASRGDVPISLTLVEYTVAGQRTITGVFRDLSEERKLQSELQQTRKMEAIGHLAAGIAHEINTPTQFVSDNLGFLTESFDDLQRGLDAHAELLAAARDAGVLSEARDSLATTLERLDVAYLATEIPRALEQSRDGLERIAGIVDAMKSFSRPGTEAKRLFDLNRSVRNAAMIARNEWEPIAEVELDLEGDSLHVLGYEAEINQVLLGMILNGAQAISSARVVDAERPLPGRILLSTRRLPETAVVEVVDDGAGMSESVRQKIFDPFFTTKEVGQGTGQGLAVAWSVIVEKHGGSIEVESREGEGARFRIGIPLERVEPECDPEAKTMPPLVGSSSREG